MANPNFEITIRVHQHVLDAVLDVIAAARAIQAKRLAVGEADTFLLSSGDEESDGVFYDISTELDALDAACVTAARAIATPRPCWRLWNWLRRVARTARCA